MRRPISFLFFAFAGGIFFFNLNIFPFSLKCLISGLFILFAFTVKPEEKLSLINLGDDLTANAAVKKLSAGAMAVVFLLGGLWFSFFQYRPEPLNACDGQQVTILGTVQSAALKNGYVQTVIKVSQFEADGITQKWNGKVLVNVSADERDSRWNYDNGGDGKTDESEEAALQIQEELIGRKVRVAGIVSLPSPARNPKGFDYKLYLKTQGVSQIITAGKEAAEICGRGSLFVRECAMMRIKFGSEMDKYLNRDETGLVMGMLFGDKTFLDEDIYEMFQKNGTAHILAVSGIHTGIVYFYIEGLLTGRKTSGGRPSKRRLSIKAGGIVTIACLFIYAALASFSPSVVRAAVMISLHVICKIFYKRYDLLCSASAAGLLMLLYNPYQLFHPGFQLSFIAVFSMAFTLPWADMAGRKVIMGFGPFKSGVKNEKDSLGLLVISAAIRAFIPLWAVQIGMAPVTAYMFNQVSIAGFFVNVPVIFLAGILIPAGVAAVPAVLILSGVSSWIFSGIGLTALSETLQGVILTALSFPVKAMLILNQICSEEWASFQTVSPSPAFLALYYFLLCLFTSEWFWIMRKKKKYKKGVAAAALILFFSAAVPWLLQEDQNRAHIVFIDVGQGDAVHLRLPDGRNILIDSGGSAGFDVGKKVLLPYFLKNGVSKIDLALITHLHTDHYGGLVSLTDHMKVEKLGIYEGNSLREKQIEKETGLAGDDILYLGMGDKIQLGDSIWIEVLWPEKRSFEEYRNMLEEEEDENATSLIFKLHWGDASVLLTGDLGFEGEEVLVGEDAEGLKANVLKVGHHGSRYSSSEEFLGAVKPNLAVIQVGKNHFGHPHPDALERLEQADAEVRRNDLEGAVLLDIVPEGLRVWSMIPQSQQ